MGMSNEEINEHNRRAAEACFARRNAPLTAHVHEVLSELEEEAEEQSPEPASDLGEEETEPTCSKVAPAVPVDPLAWSEVKKYIPAGEDIDAAIRQTVRELTDAKDISPLEKLGVLTDLFASVAKMHAAALKAVTARLDKLPPPPPPPVYLDRRGIAVNGMRTVARQTPPAPMSTTGQEKTRSQLRPPLV